MSLGLGITTFMFVFTYLPQAAVMTFTQGPLAAVSAAILVLSESSTLFTVLSKSFLIEDALVDTFDGVLVSKGSTDLVSSGRHIQAGGDSIAKLGKLIKKPFAKFAPNAIIRYFLYLPLNFIPVVGTIMFVILQGRRAGPTAHSRYFQLKGWSNSQKQTHVQENKAAYTRYTSLSSCRDLRTLTYPYSFGIALVLLELVPVASIIFAFTNTVGAALWESTAPQFDQGHSANIRRSGRGYGEGKRHCTWHRAKASRTGQECRVN